MRKMGKKSWHILCAVMALVLMISNMPILDAHAEPGVNDPVIMDQQDQSGDKMSGDKVTDENGLGNKKDDAPDTDLDEEENKEEDDSEEDPDKKQNETEKKETNEENKNLENLQNPGEQTDLDETEEDESEELDGEDSGEEEEVIEEQPEEVKVFLEAVDTLWNSESVNQEELQALIQAVDDAYKVLTEEQQAAEEVQTAVLTEEVRAYLDAVLALWDIEEEEELTKAVENIKELYDGLTQEQKETVLMKAIQEALAVLVEVEPIEIGDVVYVRNSGSDTDGTGTKEKPFATLACAVEKAEDGATVYVLSDLTVNEFVNVWKKEVTIKSDGGQWTVTRGDISARQDNARSTYNPAMIEVNGKLRLENIILDDAGKTAGTRYAQASTDGTYGNSDTVQDAIIATYDGDGDVVILGKGTELKGYGGMSAVRLSGGTMTMESGSKITGGKKFDTRGGGDGPAGGIWIQGGSLTMEEGSEITGIMGRAVYVDSGSAVISGTISGVVSNGNMWNNGGTAIHARNGGKVTLNGTIGDISGDKLPGNAVEVINKETIFTMADDSSIQNAKQAIRIVGGTVNMKEGALIKKGSAGIMAEGGKLQMDGTITELTDDGSHVVQVSGGAKVTIGSTGYITKNWGGYGAIYLQCGTVDIYGHIDENYVMQRGGGIGGTNHSDDCYVTLYDGATISNNYSNETGGGIMMSKGVFTMKGGTISGNIAKEEGGGVFIRQQGSFIMEGGIIENNISGEYGGGVAYRSGGGYVDLQRGTISNNLMGATVKWNEETKTATVTGGTSNDLGIHSDGAGSVNSYLRIASDVTVNRRTYMITESKTVTVTDGTKIGNAGSSDIQALNTQGEKWGFANAIATLWAQNMNAASVTISGLKLDSEKPVWMLAKNGDSITRIPAALKNGVVSFRAPASEKGCALAVMQPADGDVYVNLTSTLSRIAENNIPAVIPYEVVYGLREDAKDVLNGAKDATVTFLFQSENGEDITPAGNKASLRKTFDQTNFKAGENVVMGAVLTFTSNGQKYTFYSNSVSIPMLAVYTVTFNSNGGNAVAAQEVIDGETASRPADPTRSGYTFNGWTLNGTAYNFAVPVTGDITLTAQWSANTTTGGTTGGGGTSGGGGGGTTSAAPAPAPAETTILPPEVPLAEPTATATVTPVAATRPAAPEAEAIVEEVEEPEVPLAGAEEPEEEEEPVLAELEESEVPLASGDSWALLNLLLMILTVVGVVITTAGIMRKKEDEYEEEDSKNGRTLRLISVVPAVVSAVVFFLTENLGSPMVFVDRMTVVMICITVVEAAVMLLVYREKALAKNTEK